MADNPIKYSDLLAPDNSIQQAIEQLKELQKTYIETLNTIKSEADKAMQSIKGVSGATEQGRKVISQTAMEAEKLRNAQVDLNLAQGEGAKELARLKLLLQEQNRENKESAKLAEAQAGSYNALSVEYSRLKRELNNVSAEERKNNALWKEKEKRAREIYQEMDRLQRATGKYALNVGNYAESFKKAFSELRQGKNVMGNLGTMLKSGVGGGAQIAWGAIAKFAGGIGIAMGAMKAFNKVIQGSQTLTDKYGRAMSAVSRVTEGFFESISRGNFTSFIDGLKDIIKNAEDAYDAMDRLSTFNAFNTQKTAEFERKRAEYRANIRKGVEVEKNKELLKELEEQEKKYYKTAYTRNKDKANADLVSLTGSKAGSGWLTPYQRMGEKGQAEALKEAERIRKQYRKKKDKKLTATSMYQSSVGAGTGSEYYWTDTEMQKKYQALKNYGELSDKQVNQISEAYAKAEQAETTYWNKVASDNRLMSSGTGGKGGKGGTTTKTTDPSIATEKEYQDAIKARREYEDLLLSMVEDSASKEISIVNNTYERKIEDLRHQLDVEKTLTTEQRETINNTIIALDQKRQSEVDAIVKKQAEEELKWQQETNKKAQESALAEFDIQQKLAQSEFDLLDTTEEQKTKFKLQAEKERWKKILELNAKYGNALSDAEVKTIQNTIAKIDQELTNGKDKTSGKDIYDIVGLKLTNDQKQAVDETIQYVTSQLSTLLSQYAQIADAEYATAQQKTENAKNLLQTELEARANGYASNVATAQKELALAQKEEEEKLKTKEKYQKAQQQLESVQQAVSLVTASANIWQSMSGIPIVGPALAIASIATMWASFLAVKIKASQATKYREGGYEFLDGGSHQSGNDVNIGTTQDGKERRAEGGETLAIFNKTATRKYRDKIPSIVDSINHGLFEQRFGKAFSTDGLNILAPSVNINTKNLERDVAEIRRQGERNTTYVGTTKIIQYKNLTRIVQ